MEDKPQYEIILRLDCPLDKCDKNKCPFLMLGESLGGKYTTKSVFYSRYKINWDGHEVHIEDVFLIHSELDGVCGYDILVYGKKEYADRISKSIEELGKKSGIIIKSLRTESIFSYIKS